VSGQPEAVLCPRCLHDGVLERTLARAEAAKAKLAEVRGVLLEGGQPDGTARRRALAVIGTEEEAALARHLVAQAKAADAGYKVAAVRAGLYTFLHQYGRSELPAFKVAIDLAVSLRKIVDDLGDEEERP
jgi:hypothetical protein